MYQKRPWFWMRKSIYITLLEGFWRPEKNFWSRQTIQYGGRFRLTSIHKKLITCICFVCVVVYTYLTNTFLFFLTRWKFCKAISFFFLFQKRVQSCQEQVHSNFSLEILMRRRPSLTWKPYSKNTVSTTKLLKFTVDISCQLRVYRFSP